MRLLTPMMLATASIALGLAGCAEPSGTPTTPVGQTGGIQTAPSNGGVTFNTPTNVPVGAYTGSQRGSNSPLGVTYQDPSQAPGVNAYTGSQRGYSNSPLGFQRNPVNMPGAAGGDAQSGTTSPAQ